MRTQGVVATRGAVSSSELQQKNFHTALKNLFTLPCLFFFFFFGVTSENDTGNRKCMF